MRHASRFATFIYTLFITGTAFASGLSKPVLIGPKAIGMGGAYVGIADNATAIFHNPAGMTQISGHEIEVGADALITDEHYTPPSSTEESAKREILPVPQFGYVTSLAKPVWFGLGVFFPHGNGGKYNAASAVLTNPNEGRIYSLEISPAFAFEIAKGLSLGASLRATRVSSSLKGQLFVVGSSIDTLEDLKVDGWALGAAAGLFYKPCKEFSFGANYRSNVSAKVSGTAKFTTLGTLDTNYVLPLPTLVTAGVGIVPIENLTLGLSYDFERNSEIGAFNVNLQSVGTVSLPQNFKNSHTVHIGAEYWVMPDLALRAGYAKDLNASVPDASLNRVIGDIAAHETSAGLAYKWDRFTFQGTWNARFGKRTVPATGLAPGEYKAFVQSASLGLGIAL